MNENEKLIEQACAVWHNWFDDSDEHDYSEKEPSDIEYFIGCMLYNQFAFEKAISTMQTMDIGQDFLDASGNSYKEVNALLKQLDVKDDLEAIDLLQDHIAKAMKRYDGDRMALYLVNRLAGHINTLENIYRGKVDRRDVDFEKMAKKSDTYKGI
ncbi:MAG: hypothetical protein ABFR02_07080 [Campylobacterota bacterium]